MVSLKKKTTLDLGCSWWRINKSHTSFQHCLQMGLYNGRESESGNMNSSPAAQTQLMTHNLGLTTIWTKSANTLDQMGWPYPLWPRSLYIASEAFISKELGSVSKRRATPRGTRSEKHCCALTVFKLFTVQGAVSITIQKQLNTWHMLSSIWLDCCLNYMNQSMILFRVKDSYVHVVVHAYNSSPLGNWGRRAVMSFKSA